MANVKREVFSSIHNNIGNDQKDDQKDDQKEPQYGVEKSVEKGVENADALQKLYRNFTETLQKTDLDIIGLIEANPFVTTSEMASKLKFSRQTIATRIKYLQEKGLIQRIGADKGGHWNLM